MISLFTFPAPSDSELLGTMATRLALVERELLATKREVVEKDQYIRHLEERVAVLEGREEGGGGKGELELKCLALQRQVEEMEVRGWSLGVHVACSLGIQIVEAFCVVCGSAHQFISTGVPE